jgi:FAD/FMN-containing dehydrogenase
VVVLERLDGFGWTVDNPEEVEIATVDGRIRTANRDENPDLFWTLRGGGKFGVVSRFTYEAPRELTVQLLLIKAPPAPCMPEVWHGEEVCAMVVCYSGDLARSDEVLAPIRSLGDPIIELLDELPYTQLPSLLDGSESKGQHYFWKTDCSAELSDGLLATTRDLFAECPLPEPDLGFLYLGGALNEYAEDDGAVGNRNVHHAAGANGMWAPDDLDAELYRRWIRDAWQRLRPFSTDGSYINVQTEDGSQEHIHDTYGIHVTRLLETKKRYDPDNLFRVNRKIRPSS